MKHLVAVFIVGLVAAGFNVEAAANPKQLQALVIERAKRGVPPGMAIASLRIPSGLAKRYDGSQNVSVRWKQAPRVGTLNLEVQILDGSIATRGWARIELRKLVGVLVAAKPLKRGQMITLGDLKREQRPMARNEGWRFSPAALIGSRALANVPKGQLLTASLIEEPAPVARGTRVKVTVRRGAVTINTYGNLERPARIGELTSVRLIGNRRILRGRLATRSHVLLGGGS